jgi:hypothetical protein
VSSPSPYAFQAPPDDTQKIIRWARIVFTIALIPMGRWTFTAVEDRLPLIGGINLAVHEFGHMLFMPFGIPVLGETMVILGGSLTQFAFPLIFAGYFAFSKRHRDLHAAMVCVWWASINLVDVAVYTADARARELTLLSGATGQEDDGHDWYNLLSQWGVLNRDLIYAGRMRVVAGLMMIASIIAGLWFAWQGEKPRVSQPLENDSAD